MVLALAIGIAAAVSVATVAHTVLFQPMPFAAAERLAVVWESQAEDDGWMISSLPNVRDWAERSGAFEAVAFSRSWPPTLKLTGGPVKLEGAAVSDNFFSTLGAHAHRGRLLEGSDFEAAAADVVIFSYELWQERFGADDEVLGTAVTLDGTPYTVVGVLPPGFAIGQPLLSNAADVLVPVDTSSPWLSRGNRMLRAFGRLAEGLEIEQARTELGRLGASLAEEYPETNRGWTIHLEPLRDLLVGDLRRSLYALVAAGGLLFLIGCANVANLLAVQLARRRSELALRAALGARPGRIFGRLAAESVPLVVAGAAAGLALAYGAARAFGGMLPDDVLHLLGAGDAGAMSVATVLIAVVTILLIQLVSLFELSSVAPARLLNASTAGSGESARSKRAKSILVAAEIGLALVLLIGATLLIRSFSAMSAVDLGFETAARWVAGLELPLMEYQDGQKARRLLDGLSEELERDSRIQGAAAVNLLPLKDGEFLTTVAPDDSENLDWQIGVRGISPDYPAVMGIPLLRGRTFTREELLEDREVVVLSESAAKKLWPGGEALGGQVTIGWGERQTREVIGVIGDVHHQGITLQPQPMAYLPYPQTPVWVMNLVVETTGAPAALAADVRKLVRAADPDVVILRMETLDEVVATRLLQPRLFTRFLIVLAASGLLLALLGIYGVTAFVISTQTREFGIRTALGAERRDILRGILRKWLGWIGLGAGLGLAGAWAFSRFLASRLFGVEAHDPLTFVAATLVLGLVALAAVYLPARRNLVLSPTTALRTTR
jgi:putative ABC transport system permease protein